MPMKFEITFVGSKIIIIYTNLYDTRAFKKSVDMYSQVQLVDTKNKIKSFIFPLNTQAYKKDKV